MFKIGIGYDQHKFTEGKKLMLGGVEISHTHGMLAHSDGDVVIHSIADAILGAIGRGDIGEWFPDNDPNFKDIDSTILLRQVRKMMERENYFIQNLDCIIIADEPKLTPHKQEIKEKLAAILDAPRSALNIKATRTEGLGSLSDAQGIAVKSVVLLKMKD